MSIEDIKGTLENNGSISDELKDNIVALVEIFSNNFPNVSLEKLNNNLKTLKIKRVSKYVTNEVAYYSGASNTLYINYSKITDDDDVRHIIMHQLLHIITYNGRYSGFNENNFFRALNEGFTEIITNNIVGNEGDKTYFDDEVVATNLLSSIVGVDVMERCYFNNDAQGLMQELINVGGEI